MGMQEFSTICGTSDIAVHTPLDSIFAQFTKDREAIKRVAELVKSSEGAMSYFIDGARVKHNGAYISVCYLYDEEAASAALNATYWSRVMQMTDIMEYMAAADRNQWNESIRKHTTPDFNIQDVRYTMRDLMARREEYFAKRVDGLFRELSGNHVTNLPQAFSKRMIIENVLNQHGSVNTDKCAYIHDLRVVIAKFMGRNIGDDIRTYNDIYQIHEKKAFGEWHDFDGGSWQLKLFKVGTAHLQIHPDMAWRLNQVLASLYPMAIPAKLRQKSPVYKEHPIETNLVSPKVLAQLAKIRPYNDSYTFDISKQMLEETQQILFYLGGVVEKTHFWYFDYPIKDVIFEIHRTGVLPEQKTHQYYPTPSSLAQRVVNDALIGDTDEVLEPEAGMGGISMFLPKERTTCVEISSLHCKVLEAKGFHTVCADFLAWHTTQRFDRIVMNPPFSDGRALEHLKKAFSLLKATGRLSAILPASMRDKEFFEGWTHKWSEVIKDEFKGSGTGVSVVLLTLSK